MLWAQLLDKISKVKERDIERKTEQMLLVLFFCLFNSLFGAFLFYQHDIYWPFNQAPCLQQVCSCYRLMCVLYPCAFSMWLKSAFASGIPHSLWTVSGPGFIYRWRFSAHWAWAVLLNITVCAVKHFLILCHERFWLLSSSLLNNLLIIKPCDCKNISVRGRKQTLRHLRWLNETGGTVIFCPRSRSGAMFSSVPWIDQIDIQPNCYFVIKTLH